jgi:pyruvate/2-oxoglutarate dehydrogenase complex dihydrolipoamide acyltransferase (E2) component
VKLRVRALERRKLPEELDQLSGLARPWLWLGVGALTLAVAALVAWSFAGRIPRTVSGSGVVTVPGGLASVGSTASGPIERLLVSPNSVVRAGQEVALVGSGSKQTKVTAPFSGQILGLDVIDGQVVQFGQPLYTIQRSFAQPNNTSVYLFVPSGNGAGLAPGMPVNITVSTAPSGAFGVLRGKISRVSGAPLSTTAVTALVGNPDLAQSLTKKGPPLLAEVALTRDNKTRSGFAWSTPKGPPFPLAAGTPVTAKVIQQQQKPIDVVFGT